MTPEDRIAELEAEVAKLEAKLSRFRCEAERREEQAILAERARAESCEEHGREIRHLRHLADWGWSASNAADQARRAVLTAIIALADNLGQRTEPADPAWLVTLLGKVIESQRPAMRRYPGYPNLADCLRAGGCGHEGLSEGLKRDIAEALGVGLEGTRGQGALFGRLPA